MPGVGLAVGVVVSLATVGAGEGPHRELVRAVTAGGVGGALGALALGVGWTVLRRQQRPLPGTVEAARTFEEH